MQDIVLPLGKFLEWAIQFVPVLGNLPNMLFLIGGFVGVAVWMKMQADYNKIEEKDGYIK